MSGLVRASVLVLALCGGFVWCGEVLTDVSGGGGGTAGGEVGVELGEAVFFGKGKCSTCHTIGAKGSAVRCPNLGATAGFTETVAVRAAARKAEEGLSAVAYLVESLYDPDAFVVSGFPKGLMPPVNRPPIGLSGDEIASVVMYLLTEGGVEADGVVLDEIRQASKGFAAAGGGEEHVPIAVALPRGDAEMGKWSFGKLGCVKCHAISGVSFPADQAAATGGASVGPELTAVGSIQTREYLIESVLEPNAVVVADPPGVTRGGQGSYAGSDGWSKMPRFHSTMTLQQMLDIGEFLTTLTDEQSNRRLYE